MNSKTEEQAVKLNACSCEKGKTVLSYSKEGWVQVACLECNSHSQFYLTPIDAADAWNIYNPLPAPAQVDTEDISKFPVNMEKVNAMADVLGENLFGKQPTTQPDEREEALEFQKSIQDVWAHSFSGNGNAALAWFDLAKHLIARDQHREQPLRQRIGEMETTQRINQQSIDNFIRAIDGYKEQNQTLRYQLNKLVEVAEQYKISVAMLMEDVLSTELHDQHAQKKMVLQSLLTSLKTEAQHDMGLGKEGK